MQELNDIDEKYCIQDKYNKDDSIIKDRYEDKCKNKK